MIIRSSSSSSTSLCLFVLLVIIIIIIIIVITFIYSQAESCPLALSPCALSASDSGERPQPSYIYIYIYICTYTWLSPAFWDGRETLRSRRGKVSEIPRGFTLGFRAWTHRLHVFQKGPSSQKGNKSDSRRASKEALIYLLQKRWDPKLRVWSWPYRCVRFERRVIVCACLGSLHLVLDVSTEFVVSPSCCIASRR